MADQAGRPRFPPRQAAGRGRGWYRGDCHVHTARSYGGELTPEQVADAARASGMDFIAITEHNTADTHGSWGQLAGDDLLVILGQEATTQTGHWLALGIDPDQVIEWRYGVRDEVIGQYLGQVRLAGGLCVAAHPHAPYPGGVFMYPFAGFDAVEVWNGLWCSDRPWNADNGAAVAEWGRSLAAGIRSGRWLPAIGSSDTHLHGQMAIPHTVVLADELSTSAVLAGIKAGRSWIAGSAAVDLSLSARAGERSAGIGDELITRGDLVRVRTEVGGVPSGLVSFHTDRGTVHRETLPDAGAGIVEWRTSAAEAVFVRVEVRDPGQQMAALTNPVILSLFRAASSDNKLHLVTVLIAVWGASPGVGKTTLCAGLASQLTDAGLRVDHFREEEILTRPQFAAVAEEFQVTGAVELNTLLTATARFVEAMLAREDDVVVADALVPFVPSLLAWGHSDEAIAAFTADLAEVLAPVDLALVYLDGTAETALARAAQREGPQWLAWYIAKLARYKVSPPVSDLVSATRYLQRERAVTLAVARRQEWDVVFIEGATEMTPDQVLRTTQQELCRWTNPGAPLTRQESAYRPAISPGRGEVSSFPVDISWPFTLLSTRRLATGMACPRVSRVRPRFVAADASMGGMPNDDNSPGEISARGGPPSAPGPPRVNDYDSFAEAYAAENEVNLLNAYYERPATLALAGDVTGRRILDAGCGSGPLFAALRDRGAVVTGFDSSAEMLKLCRLTTPSPATR